MREIQLTQGFVTIVDDEEFENLAGYRWFAHRGKTTVYAYRRGPRTPGKQPCILMHRVIARASGDQDVDHRDGDGLNNQRTNLRLANDSQNAANRTRLTSNTSGRRGVTWHRKLRRWQVSIKKSRKAIYLGLFDDLDDAARAYDVAARELFGEFARPNFEVLA